MRSVICATRSKITMVKTMPMMILVAMSLLIYQVESCSRIPFARRERFFFLPDKNSSFWHISQLCKVDLDRIVTRMSEEELSQWYLYNSEATCQVLDEITRRTGRLTKFMRLIDMTNMQLLKMNRTYVKRDAAASKAYEVFYPQLLGTMFLFNSPGWLLFQR